MQVTDVKIHSMTERGRMKAALSITLDNEFVVHDVRLVQGEQGLFVAMPSRKREDGTGWHDHCHPIRTELRDNIVEAVIAAYQDELAKEVVI